MTLFGPTSVLFLCLFGDLHFKEAGKLYLKVFVTSPLVCGLRLNEDFLTKLRDVGGTNIFEQKKNGPNRPNKKWLCSFCLNCRATSAVFL